ncbi:MAG: phosphatase PAP2 family protein, partial [Alphaproteobacteria bacterium]|nr:phosphatase PAP2 family protein [Alphaproteobacteria bacterium]
KWLSDFVRDIPFLASHRNWWLFSLIDELGRPKNWASGSLVVLLIASFSLYLKRGNRLRQQWVLYAGRIFCSVAATSFFVTLIKQIAGRYRPYNVTADNEITFYSFNLLQGGINKLASMPSGHAANAAAIFFALYFINAKGKHNIYVLLFGLLVMAQRVITLNHYFSDLVAGFGFGLLGAYLALWFWRNFIKIGQ